MSGALEEETRVWSSQEGEKDKLFSTFLNLNPTKHILFFPFKPRADDYTTKQLKLCIKDYIVTMYPA